MSHRSPAKRVPTASLRQEAAEEERKRGEYRLKKFPSKVVGHYSADCDVLRHQFDKEELRVLNLMKRICHSREGSRSSDSPPSVSSRSPPSAFAATPRTATVELRARTRPFDTGATRSRKDAVGKSPSPSKVSVVRAETPKTPNAMYASACRNLPRSFTGPSKELYTSFRKDPLQSTRRLSLGGAMVDELELDKLNIDRHEHMSSGAKSARSAQRRPHWDLTPKRSSVSKALRASTRETPATPSGQERVGSEGRQRWENGLINYDLGRRISNTLIRREFGGQTTMANARAYGTLYNKRDLKVVL